MSGQIADGGRHMDVSVERDIGRMINEVGRLRMLSHRIALFCALNGPNAELDVSKKIRDTIDEFRGGLAGISGEIPELSAFVQLQVLVRAAPAFRAVHSNARELLDQVDDYHSKVKDGVWVGHDESVDRIVSFVTTEMLAALEGFISYLCDQLRELSAVRVDAEAIARNALVAEFQTALSKVNSRIRMLSINARIEASRAGAAGAAFSVVANEVSRLSDASDEILRSVVESMTIE